MTLFWLGLGGLAVVYWLVVTLLTHEHDETELPGRHAAGTPHPPSRAAAGQHRERVSARARR